MKYLLTGGGTGGHVYPALAIADEIRRRQEEAEFLYLGLRDKLESWVVPGKGYPIQFVRSRPFPRSLSIAAFLVFGIALGLGVLKSLVILLRFRPDVIIGTGGYVSAPALFAHSLLRKVGLSRARVFIYEPNAYPGMLNQVVGKVADRIGLAFEQAGRWFDMKRVAVVGYPVRRELLEVDRQEARRSLGIDPDKLVVLAFGGSGGARAINEAVVEVLPVLRQRPEVLVLHITGRYSGSDYNAVQDTEKHLARLDLNGDTSSWYRRFDYMEDIQKAYGAADLVVCRGGAATLTEICVCGLPALIVPLAGAADDHQAMNARELEKRGAARVLYQKACWEEGQVRTRVDGPDLARQILELLEHPEQRHRMATAARAVPRPDSLDLIFEELGSLVDGGRPPPLNLEFPLSTKGLPRDPNALLQQVKKLLEEAGGVQGLEPRDLAYLRYQADLLVASEDWYEIPQGRRSVGIKLVGYLQYREHVPLLLGILQDRTPVSWLRRRCGGDYRHGGIVRRNVIEYGILLLGLANQEIKETLLESLKTDPYFEVRAMAAQALGALYPPDEQLEAALIKALEDCSPGVVCQAIRALGSLARQPEVQRHFKKFYLHGNWQFRQEVVVALQRLLERGILSPRDLNGDVEQILATSPYFKPEFPLKKSLDSLAAQVRQQAPGSDPGNQP